MILVKGNNQKIKNKDIFSEPVSTHPVVVDGFLNYRLRKSFLIKMFEMCVNQWMAKYLIYKMVCLKRHQLKKQMNV